MKTEDNGRSLVRLFKEVCNLTEVLQTARIIPNNHHEVELLISYINQPLRQIEALLLEPIQEVIPEIENLKFRILTDLEYLVENNNASALTVYNTLLKQVKS